MKEIWKDIEGYKGYYQISNFGNVRSVDRVIIDSEGRKRLQKSQIRKISKGANGYLSCNLCKNGQMKNALIHRLVAQAFIQNPNNLPEVNHKDEVKTNNHVENLEWCDAKYNTNYGTAIQRMTEKLSKTVLQIDIETNQIIAEYPSTMEAERQLNIYNGSISKCCKGERKTAGGYKWRYKG